MQTQYAMDFPYNMSRLVHSALPLKFVNHRAECQHGAGTHVHRAEWWREEFWFEYHVLNGR